MTAKRKRIKIKAADQRKTHGFSTRTDSEALSGTPPPGILFGGYPPPFFSPGWGCCGLCRRCLRRILPSSCSCCVLSAWQCVQSVCRLLWVFVPPNARGMMWSTSWPGWPHCWQVCWSLWRMRWAWWEFVRGLRPHCGLTLLFLFCVVVVCSCCVALLLCCFAALPLRFVLTCFSSAQLSFSVTVVCDG